MAILDMIPPEYWRQLQSELNALDWEAVNTADEVARRAERERRAKAYDEAIRKAKSKRRNSEKRVQTLDYYRKYRAEHREKLNAYKRERYARQREAKSSKSPNKPI